MKNKRINPITLKTGCLCFLVILCSTILLADELADYENFEKANELYKEGKYREAIEQYDRILSNGRVNGALFYNLGNAYFKLGSIGYAILYYEKAMDYLPRDTELKENIAFARAFLQDSIEEKKPSFIVYVLSVMLGYLTLRECAAMVSILVSITLICAILLCYRKSTFLKNVVISLLILCLVSAFLLGIKGKQSSARRGVVIAELTEIKSAPSADATTEFIIHEGTDFYIIESIKEWVKIRLRDGKTGWTTNETFKQI
jgi:tetratricopeptide (TPR) repeat protein